MTCPCCSGLMIEGHFLDVEGAFRHMGAISLRCATCGQVYDSAIELNRLGREEKVAVLPSGEPDYQDDEVHLGAESFIKITPGP